MFRVYQSVGGKTISKIDRSTFTSKIYIKKKQKPKKQFLNEWKKIFVYFLLFWTHGQEKNCLKIVENFCVNNSLQMLQCQFTKISQIHTPYTLSTRYDSRKMCIK